METRFITKLAAEEALENVNFAISALTDNSAPISEEEMEKITKALEKSAHWLLAIYKI